MYKVEFTDKQRALCKTIGEAAGVKVLRIINEPTAAAIAYGLHHRAQQSESGSLIIMVFDFGGGTLDVSLLGVESNVFETISVSGDEHLGGEDINHVLMNFFLNAVADFIIQQRNALQPQQPQHEEREVVVQQLKANNYRAQLLRDQVEKLKIELSQKEESELELDVTEFIDKTSSKKQIVFKRSLTRKELEDIGAEIFERVMVPVREVLEESGIAPSQVDEVVLVGGSTRIPKVRQLLADFFGKPPNSNVDPDQAVAMGTAIQVLNFCFSLFSANLCYFCYFCFIFFLGGYNNR
jgi:molecular chaperone DnaK (HSP70)